MDLPQLRIQCPTVIEPTFKIQNLLLIVQLGAYSVLHVVNKRQVPCHAIQAAPLRGLVAMHAPIIQPN